MNENNSNINSSFHHGGRFGNLFFINMALSFIAEKNNLHAKYKEEDKFIKLGIDFYLGKHTYPNTIPLLDKNFLIFIKTNVFKDMNLSIENNVWCQTEEFSNLLYDYFHQNENKNKILMNNVFNYRYKKNNDLFVHVRLGDVVNQYNSPYEYYDNAIENISFENGFISSDSIDHDICKKLINKYNLKIIDYDEVKTIMFGSTCKNVILSSGTFSWLIGLFSFYSNVFYPKIKKGWHGNIFVFKHWKELDFLE